MFCGMPEPMSTADAGRLGGRKSRRRLSPDQARAMVRIREARKLFRSYHARCFWWVPSDLVITLERVAWVADHLRKRGGRLEWRLAARLDALSPVTASIATPES